MIIPLGKLVEEKSNKYELTCAMVRRALQVSVTGDVDLKQNEGKVVSTAIKQILDRKVEYRLEA